MSKNPTSKLEILLQIFVVIVVFLALFFEGKGINLVTEWFTKIFISMVYTIIAAAFVGAIVGHLFKDSDYNYEFFGMEFNVPIMILTFILKILLF